MEGTLKRETMKTLHLNLKQRWFDMILSGEKTEEYREVKPYWIRRLLHYDWQDNDRIFVDNGQEVEFDTITFKNGYSKDARKMVISYKGVRIGNTKEGWSDRYQTEVFVISLGKILEIKP